MTKATWNGAVVAESDDTIVLEGNHYFPANSLNKEFFSAEFDDISLPLEGHGKLLFARRQWRDQRRRGVVLPGAFNGSREHQRARGFLERRQDQLKTSDSPSAASQDRVGETAGLERQEDQFPHPGCRSWCTVFPGSWYFSVNRRKASKAIDPAIKRTLSEDRRGRRLALPLIRKAPR